MTQILFEQLITLYIINYLENYRNAYSLVKTLSRKFGIIDFNRIIDDLIKRKHVTETVKKQMGHYTLTIHGELFLKEHLDELKKELKETYLPADPEYMQAILSHSED